MQATLRKNCRCDNDHCIQANGEVRKLPTGGGGNAILCLACYMHEMKFRKHRNKYDGANFDLPAWITLEIYE